ncbi:hypothetical protein [Pseudoxanthomonas mexicana]|jgi:hypothetical protein|uniref:hypothetical protein n=1 Tax=Pseudoxanthomonas mexicana TaxID=128785 RepID=UPI0022F3EE3C|nr:hypothetical protein [Pseudoxanthomonas mexicana]WBX92798.1 hypothetical protein PE064_13945 [Pseudoxanthomonas mexicana]
MASSDSEYFYHLPPLTSDDFVELSTGSSLPLLLLEYVPTGAGIIFAVEYIHRELTYRTLGQKDAVAFGKGRLADGTDQYQDVRILFSRPNKTATLRGLVLEGQVKAGRLGPNNSFKPTPLRGAA